MAASIRGRSSATVVSSCRRATDRSAPARHVPEPLVELKSLFSVVRRGFGAGDD
jgi:hypothetical protein